jgi:hypothetical protein
VETIKKIVITALFILMIPVMWIYKKATGKDLINWG